MTSAPKRPDFGLGTWGHNHRLSPEEVNRAILEYVMRKAQNEGKPPPCGGDFVRFRDQAKVMLLDEDARAQSVAVGVVTWEES